MDLALFVGTTSAFTAWLWKEGQNDTRSNNSDKNCASQISRQISYVTPDNEIVLPLGERSSWCRATYILVMHEPPHLFYEPKEWSTTSVLLLKTKNRGGSSDDSGGQLELPGGNVFVNQSYEESAIQQLKEALHIDVCRPENCLHHLFTFPYRYLKEEDDGGNDSNTDEGGVWGDFYECVYRGTVEELQSKMKEQHQHPKQLQNDDDNKDSNGVELISMSLAEVKDLIAESDNDNIPSEPFVLDTKHALKLYFQRQGDLRAKRRLLKGYSSLDMAHYGLRSEKPLVLMDFNDDARNAAVDYTMQTDDGMAPRLLYQAEIILLGVSRSGKTPLSIFISQMAGLKVANIPLVFELQPPKELTDDPRIDPKRVFCLTRQVEEMEKMRASRLQRELKNSHVGGHSTYADCSYIRKDLAKARNLAKKHGYTEIDVTGRALEEAASIIISKMKERFPEMHIN